MVKAVDDMYEFDGEILAASGKAVLFQGQYWDEGQELWLPRSRCEIEIDPTDPTQAHVLVPEWLAKKNGLADRD